MGIFQLRTERRADETIELGTHTAPLVLSRNDRAKRYVLRLRPDGTVRLTIPRRGSVRYAREFAARNLEWLKKQFHRMAACQAEQSKGWRIGSEILFRGERTEIRRGTASQGGLMLGLAGLLIGVDGTEADVELDLREIVEGHLRGIACTELPARVHELAAAHGVTVQRVSVRNQRSRWGSCSRNGAISLNWRLIQMPPMVSDYIILHELMHRRQMNHSRAFWREVEAVCPAFRAAEKWLRENGSSLRR